LSTEPDGEQLAAISNAIVKVLSDSYGRGPTKAKTYAFDEHVLCVLEDVLTTVERTLVDRGKEDLVRRVRLRFQEKEAKQFMAAVEGVTGQRVIAYNSQITFHPEVAFEMFVLDS
jgi:uncharacterized protein YbcI